MINAQSIKGEYFFDIEIYTMFDVYRLTTKNKNLITSTGLNFFLSKCVIPPSIDEGEIVDEFGYIGYIVIGKSREEPKLSDTSLINQTTQFNNTKTKVDENKIILTTESTGDVVDGTYEIGVCTTRQLLISRDVHERYTLPSTATVKITYTYTLNQLDQSQEEEEEDYDD